MAPPHRWFDGFVDARWPSVLTPSALRLVLAVARRVDSAQQTRISLPRLQREADLLRPTFFRAKAELISHGLLKREKVDGKWTLTLVSPIPTPVSPVRPRSLMREIGKSQQRVFPVSPVRPPDRRSHHQGRNSAIGQQKTEEQLEGKTRGPGRTAVCDYLSQQGLPGEFLDSFVAAVEVLRLEGGPTTLEAEAHRLSRAMQAGGHIDWFEHRVQNLLADAIAAAHPVAQVASKIFNGRLLDVVAAAPEADGASGDRRKSVRPRGRLLPCADHGNK